MGKITDLAAHRKGRPPQTGGQHLVTCVHCHERHPVIRLPGGRLRCVTAFVDNDHWFCLNRGCRAAWLAAQSRS